LKDKTIIVLKVIGGIVCLIVIVGNMMKIEVGMPHNAMIYVDDTMKTYIAPPCLKTKEQRNSLRMTTMKDVRALGYKADNQCKNNGGFTQEPQSLLGFYLRKIGIAQPFESRWNKDGTWNY
jgi:hypothetical protein